MNSKKIKVLIVIADYYKDIVKNLLENSIVILKKNNVDYNVIKVPGALEISLAIKINLDSNNNFDGFIALGCIIKGETHHFEIVSNESARALTKLSLNYSVPIGNGILTTYNKNQAVERSRKDGMNKSEEATMACLEMIKMKNNII